MIFSDLMHLKYCEKGSLVIFLIIKGHCSTHLLLFYGKRQNGLCLGEIIVAENILKNYLVLRESEKFVGILQIRVQKYIASCKLQKYCKGRKKYTLKALFYFLIKNCTYCKEAILINLETKLFSVHSDFNSLLKITRLYSYVANIAKRNAHTEK